jgi:hypothetical protein
MGRRLWKPIAEGELADRTWSASEEIAADLQRFVALPDPPPALWSRQPGRDLSLAGGWAGIALFFAELDRACPGEGHDETAADLLARAIEGTAGQQVLSGLYGGFPGVAWTVEHLTARLFGSEEGEDDPGEDVAALLARHLDHSPWTGEYDLTEGLTGFGVYALERSPRRWGEECLRSAVARLAETAEVRTEGVAWRTLPEGMAPELREQFPEGSFNLGVAHGVPGAISVLARAWVAGVEEARPLLDRAVAWLLAQKLPSGAGAIFPTCVAPRPAGPTKTSRVAWCYGDLGIACALLSAARAVGEAVWQREAHEIGRATTARSPESEDPADACLCHGAAGNSHLFNRLYQASGDRIFADAARTWLRWALEMRRPGARFGGFQCWADGPQGEDWYDDPGFLMGAAGIGLALLAAATPLSPVWDRVLLI